MTISTASSPEGANGQPTEVDFATSAERASVNISDLRTDFFRRLFEQHAHIRELFGVNSRGPQKQMFQQILEAATMCGEPDTEWLAEHLATHTAKHEDDGVTSAMYDEVVATFLETLASFHGNAWNDALAAEWHRRLTWVSDALRS